VVNSTKTKNLCVFSSILFETRSRNFALVDLKHESRNFNGDAHLVVVARNAIAGFWSESVVYRTTVKVGSGKMSMQQEVSSDPNPQKKKNSNDTIESLLKFLICKC
jgi:hypothetical protein